MVISAQIGKRGRVDEHVSDDHDKQREQACHLQYIYEVHADADSHVFITIHARSWNFLFATCCERNILTHMHPLPYFALCHDS